MPVGSQAMGSLTGITLEQAISGAEQTRCKSASLPKLLGFSLPGLLSGFIRGFIPDGFSEKLLIQMKSIARTKIGYIPLRPKPTRSCIGTNEPCLSQQGRGGRGERQNIMLKKILPFFIP